MPRGKFGDGAKNEFPLLDQDTQDEIARMSTTELRDFIAKVAMDTANLLRAREEDQDLKEKKEAAKDAGAVYAEGQKRNAQRIKMAMRCLGDKGGDTQPEGEASNLS